MNGTDTSNYAQQYGTNAERLALSAGSIKPFTVFYETDTTNTYRWVGLWVLVVASGGGGGGGSVTVINPTTAGANVQLVSINYFQSTGNSSVAQLAAGATFPGAIEPVPAEPNTIISAWMDQGYTVTVFQFDDAAGTKPAGVPIVFTRLATVSLNESVQLNGNYYRVQATNNGASTSTTFYQDVFVGIMPVEPASLTNNGNKRVAIQEVGGVDITGKAIPTSSPLAGPYTGQQKATASAVALPSAALVNGLVITASPKNTGTIMIGGAGVTNSNDGTGTGEALQPGLARSFACSNANQIYIIGAAGFLATDFVTVSGN